MVQITLVVRYSNCFESQRQYPIEHNYLKKNKIFMKILCITPLKHLEGVYDNLSKCGEIFMNRFK